MKYAIYLCLFFYCTGFSQNTKFNSKDLTITPLIDGTLLVPETSGKLPLAIIIAGSGPTDRNGNQQMIQNNSLRFLAEGLYTKNIATFRFDKRIVKQMKNGSVDEKNLHFGDFIQDANAVLEYFKKDMRFSKIYIIGHSQGSLIGMVTAQEGADGFITLSGAGQEIDDVIIDQLSQQAPGLVDNARTAFDDLRVYGISNNYSPALSSIFRKNVQPFIFSWMQYNPQEEIAKLKMPVLIINGDKDLQVHISEAELLHNAKPDASYKIIPKMNHVFKEVNGMGLENSETYNQPDLPVMPELIDTIADFIKK